MINMVAKGIGCVRVIKMEKLGIVSIALLLLLCYMGDANGDVISVRERETGSLIPDSDSPVYMVSQNIAASLNETFHEVAEYTLYNPTNDSINLVMLLPFSNEDEWGATEKGQPKNLTLNVDGNPVTDFSWTRIELEEIAGSGSIFSALVFNTTIKPLDQVVIEAEYDRKYFETRENLVYTYLTMSGKYWNHPIEYARFEIYVSNQNQIHKVIGMPGRGKIETEEYTILIKEFNNWTPNENIKIFLNHHYSGGSNDHLAPLYWGLRIIGVVCLTALAIILIWKSKSKSAR